MTPPNPPTRGTSKRPGDAAATRWHPRLVTVCLIAGLLVAGLLLVALAAQPAGALEAEEHHIRGQVAKTPVAHIDDQRHGLVLAIERGVDESPRSGVLVVSGPDPLNWTQIQLGGAPGAIAAGDVTGDGQDDVAIVHHHEGQTCPFPVQDMPCGIVRVYDGPAFVRGELETIAEIEIQPETHPCPPSNYPPQGLALGDITGDGLAEIALGQLGMKEGNCGVVHVIPGQRLSGSLTLDAACAEMRGPPNQQGHPPDQFGAHLELFAPSGMEAGYLVIGAPFTSSDGLQLNGRLAVHDLTEACPGDETTDPPLAADLRGGNDTQLLGSDTVYLDGVLWSASKGLLEAIEVPSFERSFNLTPPQPFPLSVAGDLTGDGQDELFAGPWVLTTDGEIVFNLGPFAQETFRGTALGPDHIVSSDRFGMRLWSLTDLRDPHLVLQPKPSRATAGETVNVSVAQMISLVPDPWPLTWQATGGTILNHTATWAHVQADRTGHVTVQATIENTTATVRIPVDPAQDRIGIDGPEAAETARNITLHVQAPRNASTTWSAPGAVPDHGTGERIEISFPTSGVHTVTAEVTLPNGTEASVQHSIEILDASIEVEGPDRVAQGQPLVLKPAEFDGNATYTWRFEGPRMGTFNVTGPTAQVPASGWGPVNVTVTARSEAGQMLGVGHWEVQVENLPPAFGSLQALPTEAPGVDARASVTDPGGDPFSVQWLIDGEPAGTGLHLVTGSLPAGWVNVTAVATDEAGLSDTLTRRVHLEDPWTKSQGPDWPPSSPTVNSHDGTENQSGEEDRPVPGLGTLAVAGVALAVAGAGRRWDWRRPGG